MRVYFRVLAVVLAVAATATAAELVVNGGFETGDFTGWSLSGNITNTGVDPGFAYSGNFGAKLGSVGADGFLSQILPTVLGSNYALSYALENLGGTPNDFGVLWGGVLVPGSDFLDAGPFRGTVFSFNLVAPGPNTQLTFFFRQDPTFWGLDDVSVQGTQGELVPEPATLGIAGPGLIAMVLLRLRRHLVRWRNYPSC